MTKSLLLTFEEKLQKCGNPVVNNTCQRTDAAWKGKINFWSDNPPQGCQVSQNISNKSSLWKLQICQKFKLPRKQKKRKYKGCLLQILIWWRTIPKIMLLFTLYHMLQTKHLHFECRCLFYCWCFCWCFIFWFCWVWGMSWQCWQKHGCSFSILYSIYFSDVFVSCFIVFVYCFVFWAADKIIGCSFSSLPAEAIQVVSSKSFIVLCLFSHFY